MIQYHKGKQNAWAEAGSRQAKQLEANGWKIVTKQAAKPKTQPDEAGNSLFAPKPEG